MHNFIIYTQLRTFLYMDCNLFFDTRSLKILQFKILLYPLIVLSFKNFRENWSISLLKKMVLLNSLLLLRCIKQNFSWIKKCIFVSKILFRVTLNYPLVWLRIKKEKKRRYSVLSKTKQCASRDIKKLGGNFSFRVSWVSGFLLLLFPI